MNSQRLLAFSFVGLLAVLQLPQRAQATHESLSVARQDTETYAQFVVRLRTACDPFDGDRIEAFAAGGAKLSPFLSQALSDPDIKLRQMSATVIRRMGPTAKDTIPALAKALDTSISDTTSNESYDTYVIEAVTAVGPDIIVPVLRLPLANSSKYNYVGVLCVAAMGKPAIPILCNCFQDSTVASSAAMALGRMRSDAAEAVPSLALLLRKLLAMSGIESKRWDHAEDYAASALGAIGTPDAIDVLIAAAKDSDSSTRLAAMIGLMSAGPSAARAMPVLIVRIATAATKLSPLQDDVLQVASRAIGNVGPAGKAAVPALAKLFKHPTITELTRRCAACALCNVGGPVPMEAISFLASAIKHDHSSQAAFESATALGNLGKGASIALPALQGAAKAEQLLANENIAKGALYFFYDRIIDKIKGTQP